MPFGAIHDILVEISYQAFGSFMSRVLLKGAEHIPGPDEPFILVTNHWNCACDPAMLSCYIPKRRQLHYWAKSGIFVPGIIGKTMHSAGNIPVDRKSKDNQALFALSIDVLKQGEAIAVFPEGGSYTVPGLDKLKDGPSWAALEYVSNVKQKGNLLSTGKSVDRLPEKLVILVAGITYSDKTRYRGSSVIEYGPPIDVEEYYDDFVLDPKAAVKKLTSRILAEMKALTANAEDLDTLNAAFMAEQIMFPDDRKIDLSELRNIRQNVIDIVSDAKNEALKSKLLDYFNALKDENLSHLSLIQVPVHIGPQEPVSFNSSSEDESLSTFTHSVPTTTASSVASIADTSKVEVLTPLLPPANRATTQKQISDAEEVQKKLLLSVLQLVPRLLVLSAPLLLNLPVYLGASRLLVNSKTLEEDLAQNKAVGGLVTAIIVWSTTILLSTGLLAHYTSLGFFFSWLTSFVLVISLWKINNATIDFVYFDLRQVVGLWKIHSKGKEAERLLTLRAEATGLLYSLYTSSDAFLSTKTLAFNYLEHVKKDK